MSDSAVLNFCNDVRKELRRGPVKGLRKGAPRMAVICPVAATINYGCRNLVVVDSCAVYDDAGSTLTVLSECPPHVGDFIRSFDAGNLPEYEGEGWAE